MEGVSYCRGCGFFVFKFMKVVFYILAFVSILLVCSSCSKTVYVPVKSTITDVQFKDRVQYDSVHVLDSVLIREKGDTITIFRYRDRYRDKFIYDTTYIFKTDSIQVPYPVDKELNRWQKIKMDFGGTAMLVIFLIVAGWFVRKKFF